MSSLQEFILESLDLSARQVFSTMLGVELPAGEVVDPVKAGETKNEVVALIGVAGSWAGAGSVCCSAELACKVCAAMLMTEATSVNEDVLDAVAELCNMIIGNVKTELEAKVGPLGLSIPTVVFGRNFRTKTTGSPDWLIIRFPWDGDVMTVKLCLAEYNKIPHPSPASMIERAAPVLETAGALGD
jgi:chemotaxis protein CheX